MKDISALRRKVKIAMQGLQGMLVGIRVTKSLEKRLPDETATVPFIVYFADDSQLMYQLAQWIAPLNAVSKAKMPVVFVVKDSVVASELAALTNSPILLTRSIAQIETFVRMHSVRGVLYVNNSQANFTALRMTEPSHIHLNHGESEKSSMVSNQLKAYDFCMIAGDAAEERLKSRIKRFDGSRLIKIGRPQLDSSAQVSAAVKVKPPLTVLYAPTWEGDSVAMAYSSLPDLGLKLIRELSSDPRITLVFRPHPKTGTWSQAALKALKSAREIIAENPQNQNLSLSRMDQEADPIKSILDADIVVSDISAMSMDAIGLNRKILLVDPATSTSDSARLLSAVPHIGPDFKNSFAELLIGLAESEISAEQVAYREYVFGDINHGTGTERFVKACSDLICSSAEPAS